MLASSRQRRSAGPEAGRGVPTPPSLPLDSTHPATGQGLHALNDPKEEVEAQKASAAPVGAIALTLFRFSIYSPSVAARQLPQGGASARPQRRAFAESGAAPAVYLYDPTRENGVQKRPQAFLYPEIKNILSSEYGQSTAEAIQNRPVLSCTPRADRCGGSPCGWCRPAPEWTCAPAGCAGWP